MSKTKIHATTQYFTEIADIVDTVVALTNGFACSIIEIEATNFALLSQAEQYAKIAGYAGLLNSLSFPIQILIKSKREDISSYLKLLDGEAQKAKEQKLGTYITQYRQYIGELVRQNSILDKRFYVVISFSSLELGATHAIKSKDFITQAKASLTTKTNALLEQIARTNLKAKVLQKEELVRLFYSVFNPLQSDIDAATTSEDIQIPVVKGAQNGKTT
ncbi:MAG: hypothetical protein A3F31_03045 [Candidatus Levybacteria bacterium RIFCSPHIGHO2_12_FULL_38_12]|nr:MAG: hypothetical protein A2770_01050 [Candidatus Levybacteria bacterium RIFCSPHIGHO2_01_FULL_38_12]OGH22330.1 MAG: hypothetical protein A3D75_02065 [Candidatus Levybacteria bacterium RIFCSPHIGHO2_02_FULL_37_18]OGH23098.1 MAG: hypothetical protein A3F31_03045 [Candidatus Levybacteria bacterium RIFCSPHIGHO2_12_FULL_38_12]OGH33787.1 MAG: hypothetical protein A3A47_01305 [Candidatus Levybacteria bacterium RIFCSPLOWO2_01_FULL_37_20]OGH43487.1 MAG: hypothetical protein A3J14_01515 [Candidatus Lev